MDLDATLGSVAAAPFEVAALRALLSDEVVDELIAAARSSGDDEDRLVLLVDALERAIWLFAENERVGIRPPVIRSGKVVTQAEPGPRHPRWEDAVAAAATVRATLAETSGDGMQSALNVAVRGLKTFPSSEPLALSVRRIFVRHGELTGERLSLDEAYFTFSPQDPPSRLATELRASLGAHADDAGWVGPP